MGWSCLCMAKDTPSFREWLDQWPKSLRLDTPSASDLEWTWECLRLSPAVVARFGRLEPASAQWAIPVKALSMGSVLWCAIGVPFAPDPGSLDPPSSKFARIVLSGDLHFVAGKGSQLSADSVACTAEITGVEFGSAEAESVLLSVDPSVVSFDGPRMRVQARSLNHAYTLVSRRLEPRRMSSGGRIYERMFILVGKKWMSLGAIRNQVREKTWLVPE